MNTPASSDVLVRVVVDGNENVVPLFNRVEREGRQAGRGVATAMRPAERATERLRLEAQGAAAGITALGASSASLNRLNASLTTLSRFAGGAAIALVLAEVTQQGRLASQELANIGDTSERLSIPPRFLQEVQEVNNLLGQPVTGLEESLAAFVRRIGEANAGNAEAVRIFNQLGVATADAGGRARPVPEIYLDVADAIAAIEDPTQRAVAAQRLFEEGGRRLLPQLEDGRDGFLELAGAADAAGRIIGDDLVRQSQEASAALANLERDAVRPLLNTLATGFNTVVQLIERATTAQQFQSAGNLAAQVREANAELRSLTEGVDLDALERQAAGGRRRGSRAQSRLDRITEAQNRRDDLIRTLGDRGFDALGNPIERPSTDPDIPPISLDFSNPSAGRRTQRERESRAAERLAERIAETRREAELELNVIGQSELSRVALTAAFEREAQVRELLAAAAERGATIDAEALAQAQEHLVEIERITVAQERRRQAVEAAAEAEREAQERNREFNDSLSRSARNLAAIVATTGSWEDRLRGVLGLLLRIAEQGIFDNRGPAAGLLGNAIPFLSNAVGSFFGGPAASIASAGAAAQGLTFGPGDAPVFGFTFASGGAFDRGSIVDRPRSFGLSGNRRGLMGEAGPEAVLPLERMSDGRLGVVGSDLAAPRGDVSVNIFGNVDERVGSQLPGLVRDGVSQADGQAARRVERGRRRAL